MRVHVSVFGGFFGEVSLLAPAVASSLDNHQSEIVADRASLSRHGSVVPLGHARTHTRTLTRSH